MSSFPTIFISLLSIFCLLCCLTLHFREHFHLRLCIKQRRTLSRRRTSTAISTKRDTNNTETYKSKWSYQCCIIGIDEETFDFFPVSFVLYLIFLIIMSFLIIYKLNTIQIIITFPDHWSDYVLLYSMLTITVWDSLFSFYRYLTTAFCSHHFELLSMKNVLKYFSLYAIPYFILYLLQIHIYYWLYPLLIFSHFVLNIWSNWMFAKILIESTTKRTS